MKFRTFAYNEGYGQPFKVYRECPEGELCEDNFSWDFMVGWKTGMEEDGKQAIQTVLDFSHDNQTSYEQVLQRVEKAWWHSVLLDDWIELFEWQSACYSWSVVEKRELLFVNGKFAFGYEWSKQFKKGWSNYPLRKPVLSPHQSTFLTPPIRGTQYILLLCNLGDIAKCVEIFITD